MRRTGLSRLAVITVCGVLCMLAYKAGLQLPWEAALQWVLITVQGSSARTFAVVALIIATILLAFADTGGHARSLPQVALGLCVAFVRWLVGDAFGGLSRDHSPPHTVVTNTGIHPEVRALRTTAPNSCHLELQTTPHSGFVTWSHGVDQMSPLACVQLPLDRLNFHYAISGGRRWRPSRAFDDGQKVYIQFPFQPGTAKAPPLTLLSFGAQDQSPAYRFHGCYLIVHHLFDSVQLRFGAGKAHTVRIKRRSNTAC